MNITEVLETFYSDYQWLITNDDYDNLIWSEENSIAKPTLEELQDKWDNHSAPIQNNGVQKKRQEEINKIPYAELKKAYDQTDINDLAEQTLNNSEITTDDFIEAIDDIISDCKDNSLDFSFDDEDHYGSFENETDFTKLEIM